MEASHPAAPTLSRQISVGALCGAAIGSIQALVEGLNLARRFHDALFAPEFLIPQTQFFWLLAKLQRLDEGASLPGVLDVYLGPALIDKLPLIAILLVVYVILGALMGGLVAILLPFGLRQLRIELCDDATLTLGLLVDVVLLAHFNLFCVLNGDDWFRSDSAPGLLANGSLALNTAVLLTGSIWLAKNRPELLSRGQLSVRIGQHRLALSILMSGLVFFSGISLGFASRSDIGSKIPGAATAAARSARGEDMNIVLISIDSLRADHLGVYGYARDTSPNIDALAQQGTLFTRALSTTSWTLPSHASMLTSMYPDAHGVTKSSNHLGESRLTLAEILSDAGYATGAVATAPFLSSAFGFDQGFDDYIDFGGEDASHAESHRGLTSPKVHAAAVDWLQHNSGGKFFLFVHYWDVHFDYAPPPPFDRLFDPDYVGDLDSTGFEFNPLISEKMAERDLEHIVALYDGEIAYTDRYIGKLLARLKALGVLDRTLIVLTADHGEEFFEHGRKGHVATLYEEVLRVPLIVRFPTEGPPPGRVSTPVSIVDIVPTILDYLGVDSPESVAGRSLLRLAEAGRDADELPIYASLKRRLASVESSKHKLIYSFETNEWEFYDRLRDPNEKSNLMNTKAAEPPEEARQYKALLLAWLNEQRNLHRRLVDTGDREQTEIPDSMENELRALGYID